MEVGGGKDLNEDGKDQDSNRNGKTSLEYLKKNTFDTDYRLDRTFLV